MPTQIPPPPTQETTFGPYLRFAGYTPATCQASYTVLVVAHAASCPSPPILHVREADQPGQQDAVVQGIHLDDYLGWAFWRFELVVEAGPKPRVVEYDIQMPDGCKPTLIRNPRFVVPAHNQTWHWGFYSCNGFHDANSEVEFGGIQPLWRDAMACHQQNPFHAMLGGGDQLYNDPVWESPALKAWTHIPDDQTRLKHPFTEELQTQISEYYLRAYLRHWSQPVFSDALAVIPQVMVWDDHDIFDGWGSYPEHIQACPVLQGVFACARRAYALFQQHNTVERLAQDRHTFGAGKGWHWLVCMGATTALLIMDSRSERSEKQVIRPDSYPMIKERLLALPESIRHVIVVATVPVIYPKIPLMEKTLQCIGCGLVCGMRKTAWSPVEFLQKTGLANGLISQFGTVEILDDLVDHWSADIHMEEKRTFVHLLQDVAQARGFRFSMVSGDVHLAAVGRFCSNGAPDPRTDFRYMPQIISSAIANQPPPDGVVTGLTRMATKNQLDKDTEESMVKNVFGDLLKPARNWMSISEQAPEAGGALIFQYRVENKKAQSRLNLRQKEPIQTYEFQVPPLEGVTKQAPTGQYPGFDKPHTLPLQAASK